MDDSPLICFEHCASDAVAVCVTVPERCPVCEAELDSTPMRVPPFRLPCPLVHSREFPYSLVLKPTHGTFLSDYTSSSDLHVGITDSRGAVYSYDKQGVNRDNQGWSQCLAVTIVQRYDYTVTSLWNTKLFECSAYEQWYPERYSEAENNCYDFALGFMRLVNLEARLPCITSRAEFCQEMVAPHLAKLAQYISLYRKVTEEGTVVQGREDPDSAFSTQL